MPYEWSQTAEGETLTLWPHRALEPQGFVAFMAPTAALILLPALAVIGSPVLWGLLPFLLAAIWAIWAALMRNWRDGEIIEELLLAPTEVHLSRQGPRGRRQDWQANRHWVRVQRHERGGPVPHYLTLQGGAREVELGRFLTPEERLALESDLRGRLRTA